MIKSGIKKFNNIPIYFKIIIIMLVFSLVLTITSLLIQELVIKRSFLDLEEAYSLNNLKRTENTINRELLYLDQLLTDWCQWDDTYNFTYDKNSDYIDSNLQDDTFYSASLNLLYIFNNDQELIWGEVFDLENEENITDDYFTDRYIHSDEIIFTTEEMNRENPEELVHKGFRNTDHGLFLISSRPIVKSDFSGSPAGTMVMGRLVDRIFIQNLEELTQNKFNIYTEGQEHVLSEIQMDSGSSHIRKEKDSLIAHKELMDITGNPGLLLETITDRSISRYGSRSVSLFSTITIVSIIIITLFLILIFELVITKPILKITNHLEKIEQSGNTELSLDYQRRDEIGTLSLGIDTFVNEIHNQKKVLTDLNDKLTEQASTDALTGLFNRHVLDTEVTLLWKTLSRTRTQISAILIDIDYFKKYNDTYGHQEGDRCLQKVSELIIKSLQRTTDKVIRFGGEEFLVVLPTTEKEGSMLVAEKIRSNIVEEKINHKASEISSYLTISAGVSTMVPGFANNLDELIKQADQALYDSKENGRDRITFYNN